MIGMQNLAKEEGGILTPGFPTNSQLCPRSIGVSSPEKSKFVKSITDSTRVAKISIVCCRISVYHMEWMKITSDECVLKITQEGLKLVFQKHPTENGVRVTNVHNVV